MKTLTRGRGALPLLLLLAWLVPPGVRGASQLYQLDFTAPDFGSYQIVAGVPTVQGSIGLLTDALVFPATVAGSQITLPINVDSPQYELSCDVFLHGLIDSDYAFVVRLEASGAHSVSFHGGLNSIYAYQNSPFANPILGTLTDDITVHLGILMDRTANTWTVSLNGSPVAVSPFNGAMLQSIQFGMAPWIGLASDAPDTYAALDNISVLIPEPSAFAIAALGILAWMQCCRRNHR